MAEEEGFVHKPREKAAFGSFDIQTRYSDPRPSDYHSGSL